MQSAKDSIKEFLHSGNHHTVDIEQETKPAVVHEKVATSQHENVITAVDREIHQHHHQIHVQPIKDRVVESEQHHHNIVPVENRVQHHGKDREIAAALSEQTSKFRDEREVLPVQTTNSTQTVVGEHVHHHIHDVIQPVVEREVIQPHVVHTTIPVHEVVEQAPYVHKGNVLPAMTMEEFSRAGHTLSGHKKAPEHIEYEGEPLKIDGKSHVGFGGLAGGAAAGTGAGILGNKVRKSHHRDGRVRRDSSSSSSDDESGLRKNRTGTTGTAAPKTGLLAKLDPRN